MTKSGNAKQIGRDFVILKQNPRVGFVGFGEVGYFISKGLKAAGIEEISGYDNADEQSSYGGTLRKRASDAGVELLPTMEELVERSDVVILAVPGGVAPKVSEAAASIISKGKVFVDLTSCSPSAKAKAAEQMSAKGARFVDVGLMAAPKEERQAALMYAAGEGAEEFKKTMAQYGMNIVIISDRAGDAMRIKELWNIYTKGFQGLLWEFILSSHKLGIDIGRYAPMIVKTSLGDIVFSLPQWAIMHAGLHAVRKSGELREVARAMREWGMEPIVIEAAAKRLELLAEFNLKEKFNSEMPAGGYQEMLKAIDEDCRKTGKQIR